MQSASATTPPQVNLCSTGNYILLSNAVTNAATTHITSQYPGTLVGASDPVELAALSGSEEGTVTNEANSGAHTSAVTDLRNALDSMTALAASGNAMLTTELSSENFGSFPLGTFGPGVYTAPASMNVVASKIITLDAEGNPDARFYFVIGAAFTVGASVSVQLINGAQAQNVFWVVGTQAGDMTLGASSILVGNFLVAGTATLGASIQLTGRVLVTGSLTLGASDVIQGIAPAAGCFTSPPVSDPKAQTISFDTPTAMVVGQPDQSLAVSASSGLAVTLTTNSSSICTIVAGKLHAVAAGACTLTASQAGSANFLPASAVSQSITINAAAILAITFSDLTLVAATVGASYSDFVAARTWSDSSLTNQVVSYALTSGTLPVGLTFDTTTGYITGTLDISTVATPVTLTFRASSPGYPSTDSGPISITINAAPIVLTAQSITFGALTAMVVGQPDQSLAVSASSGLAVILTTNSSSICTIVSGKLHAVSAGTCTITAAQAGNATFAAATSVTRTMKVSAAPVVLTAQSITFGALTAMVVGQPDQSLTVSASSGLAVTLTTNSSYICTIVAGKLHSVAGGACTVTASQAGSTIFAAAAKVAQSTSVTVPPAVLTIAFTRWILGTGKIGYSYSDYVQAKTYSGTKLSAKTVTYSLTGALPLGLSFKASSGYFSGVISKMAVAGTYTLTIVASSVGYPSQQISVNLIVA